MISQQESPHISRSQINPFVDGQYDMVLYKIIIIIMMIIIIIIIYKHINYIMCVNN